MSSQIRTSEAGPQEKTLIVLLRFSAIVLLLAFPMMLLFEGALIVSRLLVRPEESDEGDAEIEDDEAEISTET